MAKKKDDPKDAKKQEKPAASEETKEETRKDTPEKPETAEKPVEKPKDTASPSPEPTPDKDSEPTPDAHDHDKFSEMAKKAASGAGKATGAGYKWARKWIEDPKANITRIDRFLNWVRETIPADLFDRIAKWFSSHGQSAMVIAQLLTILFFFLAIFAADDWIMQVVYGLAFFFGLILTQYAAEKFLTAGENLIASSPSKLRSTAFLDCTAILVQIIGILVFASLLREGIEMGNAGLAALGAGIWLICDMFFIVALHPSLINVTVAEDVRAGEEAIGILSFFVKTLVRIVPIFFGLGAIFGALGILVGIVGLFKTHTTDLGRVFIQFAMFSACLPFIGYVTFILYHLTIDIVRSLLVLPHKLDNLKK